MAFSFRTRFIPIAGALLVAFTSIAQAAEHPNIVFIYVDDLGYGDMACTGASTVSTPNMDKLVHDGLMFTRRPLHRLDLHAEPIFGSHRRVCIPQSAGPCASGDSAVTDKAWNDDARINAAERRLRDRLHRQMACRPWQRIDRLERRNFARPDGTRVRRIVHHPRDAGPCALRIH